MRLQGEKNWKGTRHGDTGQGEKRSYKGEVAHHCFCKLRRVGEKRRVCKKSNDVVEVNLHIIVCARSEESERSKNAMLQKEERCCKYKVTHQYWCKENSIEKKGQCHVARTETMLQGRGCLCNRGDSATAMRGCECDSANHPSKKHRVTMTIGPTQNF